MKVIIVGAGIAGVTAALCLLRNNIDVVVLEQAEGFREVGAGIQIGANGTVVMRELGLESKLAAMSVIPQSWDSRDLETGEMLFATPLGAEAAGRYGGLLYNVHRADLIDLLVQSLPANVLRMGCRCADIGQDGASAWVRLASGEVLHADAVVGADGIRSLVREKLWGAEAAQSTNILMWRALIPGERLRDVGLEERGNFWVGAGRTIISYWVRPKKLYSVLASVPNDEVKRESWTESGDISEFRKSFEGAEPRLKQMLDQIDVAFITGMYYRDPIDRWSKGRISLLGDAAHPMVPFLAQGACQGMEDAWALATVLSRSADDAPHALAEYETRRKPRTARIQAGARAMVKLVHEADRDRIRMRNGRWKGMSRIDPLAETSWGFAWKYDVVDAVNRPPGEVTGLTGVKEGFHLSRPESRRAFELWKQALRPEDAAQGYDGMRRAYERFLLSNFPPNAKATRQDRLGGVPVAVVAGATSSGSRHILHFHGGGYVLGSASSSTEYCERLTEAGRATCISVDYRLAPENQFPAALEDAVSAYCGLLDTGVSPAQIVLSGESSGAGLAIALAMELRRLRKPLPAGILAVCPFADLSLGGQSIRSREGTDPAANRDALVFLAASYFQGGDPRDPRISPLFGDFTDLPPIFLTAATNEALFDDAVRIHGKAIAQGIDVTYEPVDDSVHIFPLFSFLPETQHVMETIERWSDRILASANRAN